MKSIFPLMLCALLMIPCIAIPALAVDVGSVAYFDEVQSYDVTSGVYEIYVPFQVDYGDGVDYYFTEPLEIVAGVEGHFDQRIVLRSNYDDHSVEAFFAYDTDGEFIITCGVSFLDDWANGNYIGGGHLYYLGSFDDFDEPIEDPIYPSGLPDGTRFYSLYDFSDDGSILFLSSEYSWLADGKYRVSLYQDGVLGADLGVAELTFGPFDNGGVSQVFDFDELGGSVVFYNLGDISAPESEYISVIFLSSDFGLGEVIEDIVIAVTPAEVEPSSPSIPSPFSPVHESMSSVLEWVGTVTTSLLSGELNPLLLLLAIPIAISLIFLAIKAIKMAFNL